jgi:hypothetical protein
MSRCNCREVTSETINDGHHRVARRYQYLLPTFVTTTAPPGSGIRMELWGIRELAAFMRWYGLQKLIDCRKIAVIHLTIDRPWHDL